MIHMRVQSATTWSGVGLALRADASVEHFIAAGKETLALHGKRKVGAHSRAEADIEDQDWLHGP
jgi:hypothetical protein